jgi:hypothetical protein
VVRLWVIAPSGLEAVVGETIRLTLRRNGHDGLSSANERRSA